MKRIVCARLGLHLGSNQARCSRALRIQLIELNRGGLWGLIGGSMDLKFYSYDYRTKRFVFD